MKVLVLNASLEPLHICSYRRAANMLHKGVAERIADNGKMLRPDFPMPKVIKLTRYVRVPYTAPRVTRDNVLHRDNRTCQYCGKRSRDLTVDHVVPRCRGGRNTWTNVVAACKRCNARKDSCTPDEAGMPLLRKPLRPANRLAFEISKYSHLEDWLQTHRRK